MRQAHLTTPQAVPVIGAPLATLPTVIYPEAPGDLSGATIGVTANLLFAMPMKYLVGCTIDELMINVVAGSAGITFHVGLYADNGSRTYPGALLFDSGALSAAAAGRQVIPLPANFKVAAGAILWVAFQHSGAGPTYTAQQNLVMSTLGISVDNACGPLQVANGFGALPASYPLGAVALAAACPKIGQRVLSIP